MEQDSAHLLNTINSEINGMFSTHQYVHIKNNDYSSTIRISLALDKKLLACTGIDDVGQCMTVLEQFSWDLQSAVTANLSEQQNGSSNIANGRIYQGSNNGRHTTMLTFSCHLGDTTKDVTLDDSSTVGDLKEVAAIEHGIQLNEAQFERWPAESAIANPSDSTVLGSLGLPHFVNLKMKLHDPLPGVSIGLDSPLSPHLEMPCSVLKAASEAAMIDQLTRFYTLLIKNTDSDTESTLRMEGIKTFSELKGDVVQLTGIPFNQQEWSGFPGRNPPDETSTLASLNLNLPIHTLNVKSKAFSTASLNLPSSSASFDVSPFLAIIPQSRSPHSSSSSEIAEEDVGMDDLSFFASNSISAKSSHDLMPENVEDVKGALLQFHHEFYTRYGEGPQFVADDLQVAVQKAFGTEARKRKLLAVYVHHDRSIQSNVFCSQLLCKESISSFLNQNFVCWAWDVTSAPNKTRFLKHCTEYMGSAVTDTIRRLKKDEYPILILAQGKGRSCDVTAIIQGNSELNELMAKLIKAVDDSEEQRLQDIREEDARKAREQIKREQEQAYRESLEVDRAKMMAEKEEISRKEAEAQRKVEEEQLEKEKADRLRHSLPSEPSADCELPISQVRFRAPDGTTIMRSFLASEPLQTLVDFVGSKGYPTAQYRILKPWPKTNLLDLDMTSSLKEHKIFPQESLIIEEKPEFDS